MTWETIVSFLSSCSVLEIISLVCASLMIVSSLTVAFCYKNSQLRDILLVCMVIFGVAATLIPSKVYSNLPWLSDVMIASFIIALIFHTIYCYINNAKNWRNRKELEKSECQHHMVEIKTKVEKVNFCYITVLGEELMLRSIYLKEFFQPVIISRDAFDYLCHQLGIHNIIGMEATLKYTSCDIKSFCPRSLEIGGIHIDITPYESIIQQPEQPPQSQ